MRLFNRIFKKNSTPTTALENQQELLGDGDDIQGTSNTVQQAEQIKTYNTRQNIVALALLVIVASITYFVTKATSKQNTDGDPSANLERFLEVFRGDSTFYNESILPDGKRPGGAHALPLVVEWACSELLNSSTAAMWGLQAMLAQHFRDTFCSNHNVSETQPCVDDIVGAVVYSVQQECNKTLNPNYSGRIFSSLWPTRTLPNSSSLDRRDGAPAISLAMNITNK